MQEDGDDLGRKGEFLVMNVQIVSAGVAMTAAKCTVDNRGQPCLFRTCLITMNGSSKPSYLRETEESTRSQSSNTCGKITSFFRRTCRQPSHASLWKTLGYDGPCPGSEWMEFGAIAISRLEVSQNDSAHLVLDKLGVKVLVNASDPGAALR